ncbi:MAG: hypothetical protein IPN62_03355 [Flavobacteriales bacterium]|nr:hypothetical protein [Flavobacteriales bacterium]
MALSSSLIQFFVNRIGNSDLHTFRSEVKQLMDHIHSEAKDNPIYDKYQALLSHWTSYIQGLGRGRWMIPDNYDDSKALAYALYELVGQQEAEASGIAHKLFSSTNANESILGLNRTFLPTWQRR